MGLPFIDQRLFRTLNLGLPSLRSAPWLDLVAELSAEEPFAYLKVEGFAEIAEAALAPSPAQLVRDVDPELRPFFEEVYARPEMTDLVWLNMFRIVSSRMGRDGHFLIFIIYLPLESALLEEMSRQFRRIADRHGIRNELGFITPIDGWKARHPRVRLLLRPERSGRHRTDPAGGDGGRRADRGVFVPVGHHPLDPPRREPGRLSDREPPLHVGCPCARGTAAAVILTGATGFLGGHLMAALLQRGERLVILGRASAGASLADRDRETARLVRSGRPRRPGRNGRGRSAPARMRSEPASLRRVVRHGGVDHPLCRRYPLLGTESARRSPRSTSTA